MAKQRIALIFGGASANKNLSCVPSVAETLQENSYEVILIGITPKGKWLYYPGDLNSLVEGTWSSHPDCCPVVFNFDGTKQGIYKILDDQSLSFLHIDCAIPLLYGQGAVDGKVQGLLKLASIPCVGSATGTAAISMNRVFTHTIANGVGIRTPRYLTVARSDKLDITAISEKISENFGFPVFVKPDGSLSGISFAENEDELAEAIKTAFIHDKKVVIEERIIGKLIKCAVIGNEKPEASILGEIPLDALQNPVSAPAQISQEISYQIRDLAIKLYQLFDCAGLGALDFFVTPADELYFNQLTTIPDLSKDSAFVTLWETVGVSYSDLLDRFITMAIERAETVK